jgi:hypothetical protein
MRSAYCLYGKPVTHKAFESLSWWPMWFRNLKHVLRFLRIGSYREVLGARVEQADYDHRALLKRPPSFINWRWSTMCLVLNYLLPYLEILRGLWTADLFRGCKAGNLELAARATLQCSEWCMRFRILFDITQDIHDVRTWGSGCPCCELARQEGKTVKCPEQGRRLPEAPARVIAFLNLAALSTDAPAIQHVTRSIEMPWNAEQERSFAWDRTRAMVAVVFHWLFTQPCTLATINTVADLDRERNLWLALPQEKRHRLANYLWDEYYPGNDTK